MARPLLMVRCMNARLTQSLMIGALVLSSSGVIAAPEGAKNNATAPGQTVLNAYFALHDALARDSLEGVATAAKKITAAELKLDPKLDKEISTHATAMAGAKDLEKARAAFKDLSETLVRYAIEKKPAGVAVYHCPMVKAHWLQRADEKEIRNPYYGSEMLACGERVEK